MKQKYNWHKLELEFIQSHFDEVKPFFESKFSTYTGHIKEKTAWWSKNKKAIFERARINARTTLVKEVEELYKPTIKEVTQMYKAIIRAFQFKLQKIHQGVSKDEKGNLIFTEYINIRELEKMWKIIKEELKEFHNISNYYWDNDDPLRERLNQMEQEKEMINKN